MKKNKSKNKRGTDSGVFSLVDNIKFEEINEDRSAMSEIQIFPDAVMYHPSDPDEPMVFDNKFRDGMIKSFNESKIHPPIDFNHASGSHFDLSKEAGSAAGWVIELENRDDGLFALVEWTESGLDAIKGKPPKYKYLSPEWSTHQWDKSTGEVIAQPRLWAAALTGRPFLEGTIEPVAATEPETNNQNEKVGKMTNEENDWVDGESAVDSTEIENAEAAVVATEPETTGTENDDSDTTDETTTATEIELENNLASERARGNALEAALFATQERERSVLIDSAMINGRIVPSMLSAVQKYANTLGVSGSVDGGVDELKTFINALPQQTRPVEQGGEVIEKLDTKELSDTDRKVCKMLGITTEQMQKYAEVKSLTHDNKAILDDGEIIDL